MKPPGPEWLSHIVPSEDVLRSRLKSALAGLCVGLVGVVIVALARDDTKLASDVVFSLAALVFSLGLIGWAGSILAAGSIGAVQHHLDIARDWTEAGARRAMAHLVGVGVGGMLGAVVGTLLLT